MIEFLIAGSVIYLLAAVFVLTIRLCKAEDRAVEAEAHAEILEDHLNAVRASPCGEMLWSLALPEQQKGHRGGENCPI